MLHETTRREFLGTLAAFSVFPLQGEKPDLVLHNANIFTVDDLQPHPQAVAIADGRCLAVGSNSDVLNFIAPRVRKIDLGGRTVLPVFNDAHCHPSNAGLFRSRTALSAEVLFLRKQLGFYEERQVPPRRLNDSARFPLILWSRLFNWKDALVIVKPGQCHNRPALVHRRFDLIRRVWDARSQQLGATFSNQVYVFQEKALAIDRGDRLEVDRGSFPKWPNWKTGK